MTGNPPIAFKYGLFANLPSVSSAEGTFYLCTDTLQLFVDTGTAISEVVGGGTAAVSSVAGRTGAIVLGETDITGLVASLAALATSSALTSETSRAEAAEAVLASAVSTEIARAEAAESAAIASAANFTTTAVSSAVASEATTRAAADSTLTSNLAAEVSRAETAEASKATSSALSTETSRAEAAETTLTSNLAAEVTRAEAAESAAITSAETFATSAVAGEATTRAAAVTTLTTNLAAETTRAEGVEAAKADLVGGVVPNSQIPPLAITMPFVVSSQAAMLALTAQTGDVAIRTDVNQNFILSANDPTTLANWIELLSPVAPVQSVAGKTGTVLLVEGDISNLTSDLALKAPLASPALTGSPTAPTQAALDASTKLGTTAYTDSAVGVEKTRALAAESTNATAISTNATAISTETARAEAAEALLAPLASPALTGTPTAPTKAALTSNTDIATTAYADSAVGVETSRAQTAEALLVPKTTTVNGHALSANVTVSASDLTTGTLPHAQLPALVSGDIPANAANTSGTAANLSGTPALPNGTTATTQAALDSSTKLGTTSYADSAVGVEKTRALAAEALLAPLASPALTGTPTAPTKAALTNNTDIGTTAYTDAAVGVETTRAEAAEALLAPLASPALTGTPTAPTKTALTSNTNIATTAYADSAVSVEKTRALAAEALLAPLASPALTGTPTVPTATVLTNSTQAASTAYADNNFKGVGVTGFRDDFLASVGTNTGLTFTTTLNLFSDSGVWLMAAVGSGTQQINPVSSTFTNPGQFSLQSSATSGTGIAFYKTSTNNAATPTLGALGSNAGWELNFIAKLGSTASIGLKLGAVAASQMAVDPPTDGIWIRYDTSSSDTNFTFECRAASTSTTSASSVAADTNFHHFRIRSTAAGTILFSIDGGTETSISTNVPTGSLAAWLQILTRTTVAKTLTLDFISYMAATGRT